MAFEAIVSGRIRLRSLRHADAETLAAYRSDPEVARLQSWDAPYPVDRALELVDDMAALGDICAGQWFQIAVAESATDELMGDMAVILTDGGAQAEIGYTLAPAFQGRGIATDALRLLLDHLFLDRGLRRVHATCDATNDRSRALLERVGFRLEGIEIEAFNMGANTWSDDARYAMLAREWPGRNDR